MTFRQTRLRITETFMLTRYRLNHEPRVTL